MTLGPKKLKKWLVSMRMEEKKSGSSAWVNFGLSPIGGMCGEVTAGSFVENSLQKPPNMRFLNLLLLLCCSASALFAQLNQAAVLAPHKRLPTDRIQINERFKPDLFFTTEPNLSSPSGMPRVVSANIGFQAGALNQPLNRPFVVEIRYHWRIDQESFTAQERVERFTLNPNKQNQWLVSVAIPDAQIHSNLSNASLGIIWRVDTDNQVDEKLENNNQGSMILPVLRRTP
jgi:hypothetical protein